MEKTTQETIDEFDFHTVRRIMRMMNWTWWNSVNGDIPTLQQMKDCVISLIKDTTTEVEQTKEEHTLFSGGFEVTVYKDLSFDIKFVPVESSSYIIGL